MRYLLLSDIHSNLIAFEAVLRHARRKRWDKVIFLGDAVGYYTHPNEVIEHLKNLEPDILIVGNHEDLLFKQATGINNEDYKEDSAVSEIIQKQVNTVAEEHFAYLQTFDTHIVRDGWEVTHGALRKPWEYITTLQIAQGNAPLMHTNICFVGHTHVPRVFACVSAPSGDIWRTMSFRSESSSYRIPPKARIIFNPGSVGQPRDGIPHASYAIFDEDNRVIEHFRVEYDVLKVQRAVKENGYPEAVAARLPVGK